MKKHPTISFLLGITSIIVLVLAPLGCVTGESAKRATTEKPKTPANPVIVIETSTGTIVAELWPDKAPKTVANFLQYIDTRFFDGLIIHRVVPGFVIQGGGFAPNLQLKRPRAPVQNEARADVKNARGTLSMARTPHVHSATSQFFISLVDNTVLDHRDETAGGFGYCVFGKVIKGMDIVDTIAKVKASTPAPGMQGVPVTPVIMKSVRRQSRRAATD